MLNLHQCGARQISSYLCILHMQFTAFKGDLLVQQGLHTPQQAFIHTYFASIHPYFAIYHSFQSPSSIKYASYSSQSIISNAFPTSTENT